MGQCLIPLFKPDSNDPALVNVIDMSRSAPHAVLNFAKIPILKCPLG